MPSRPQLPPALLAPLALLAAGCSAFDPAPTSVMPIPPMPRPATPIRVATPIVQRLPSTPAPKVRATSVAIADARTGLLLHSTNSRSPRAVASTQKLLTAMLIVESGNLWAKVAARPQDTRVEPSKLGLRSGHSYTRWDLLNALLVRSSNDAAMALARDNAGSVEAFAAKMNVRARQLGCRHSNFANPHGLTAPGQYSTAEDVARIALAARRVPLIRNIVKKKEYRFPIDGGTRKLESTNKLLKRYPFCDGMKTGYTRASGRCLVTSGSHGAREVIIVQLGSQERYIWNDGGKLLRWPLEL